MTNLAKITDLSQKKYQDQKKSNFIEQVISSIKGKIQLKRRLFRII